MDEPTVTVDDCASLFLRTIPNVLRRLREDMRQQNCASEGFPPMNQIQILGSLSSRQSSLHYLAAMHHVTPSTMSRTVDVLVQRGWVNRSDDPSDRRQIMLELTDEGRAALTEFRQLMQEAMARILYQLDDDERRMLYRGLEALAALPSQSDDVSFVRNRHNHSEP